MFKRLSKHFAKHTFFNSGINFLAGMGLGVLLTRSVFDPHPVQAGVAMIGIAFLGYIYAYVEK